MDILAPLLAITVAITNGIVGIWLVGKTRYNIWNTDGRYVQLVGWIVLITVALIVLFSIDITNDNVVKWYWLIFITISIGFQSLLEWKFLKETKEHLASLTSLGVGILFVLLFMF